MQELKEWVPKEGATRTEFRCSPYHQNSALYPVIEHLLRLCQFARNDTAETKLVKLRESLAAYRFPGVDAVPLLATLLSWPPPADSPSLTLSPQKKKEKTRETLVRWLFEEADQMAVVWTREDLHWAAPSSLELLTLCLDRISTAKS